MSQQLNNNLKKTSCATKALQTKCVVLRAEELTTKTLFKQLPAEPTSSEKKASFSRKSLL